MEIHVRKSIVRQRGTSAKEGRETPERRTRPQSHRTILGRMSIPAPDQQHHMHGHLPALTPNPAPGQSVSVSCVCESPKSLLSQKARRYPPLVVPGKCELPCASCHADSPPSLPLYHPLPALAASSKRQGARGVQHPLGIPNRRDQPG